VPTDNRCEIAKAVSCVISAIFIEGVRFYRCGVGAIELASRAFQQQDLFLPDTSNPVLMKCLDSINHRYGQNTLKLGAQGQQETWQMKRHFLSPQYTTNWRDRPKIRC